MTEGGESAKDNTRGHAGQTRENASREKKPAADRGGESGERDQLREEDTPARETGRETHERGSRRATRAAAALSNERAARPANLLAVSVPVPLE